MVHLAVPHFGAWAGVTVLDGIHLRRLDSAGADDFGPGARAARVRDLDHRTAELLADAAARPATRPAPLPAEALAAFGVPAGWVERLNDPGWMLVSTPLAAPELGRVVLAALVRAAPAPGELQDFARRAAAAITAATVYEERATLAHTLREALVPAPLPSVSGVDLGASYRPAQEATQIGGDFYDVMPRPDGRWSVSIGDVCGKGIDAAVLTGQVRQSLRTAALMTDDPAATLRLVNDTMLGTGGTKFVTATVGVLARTADAVRLRLAAGGHPPGLLLRGDRVEAVPTRGTLIGMLPTVSFETVELELRPGDLLLLYTDGAPEARGPSGLLGDEALARLLAESAGLTAQAVTERLMQLVLEHLHGWAHDDIALLAIRCAPGREFSRAVPGRRGRTPPGRRAGGRR